MKSLTVLALFALFALSAIAQQVSPAPDDAAAMSTAEHTGLALVLASLALTGALAFGGASRRFNCNVAGVRPALAASAIGLASAYAIAHWMAEFFAGVQSRDPLTFAATAVLLVAMALSAGWLPRQCPATVAPARVLRLLQKGVL